MLRDISATAACYAARCKPGQLRDWRRRGVLGGIGERDGKGHVFDVAEAVRIALASFLARYGFDFRDAFDLVLDRRDQIDALVKASRTGKFLTDHVLTFSIDQDLSGPFASITGAPLSRLKFNPRSAGALQVNVSHIIRDTIDRLTFHEQHAGSEA